MDWRDFIGRLRGRQKAYIYRNNEEEPFTMIWTNSTPLKEEFIRIWDGSKFRNFKVIDRVFGVHTPSKTACWNIYTREIIDDSISKVEVEELIEELEKLSNRN